MRTLLLGEPGSGKTTEILEAVRERLRRGNDRFRLLTPTATMAEHVRNLLAREGLLVRPHAISTLSGFVQPSVPGLRTASEAELRHLLGRILGELDPPSLRGLPAGPGLVSSLVRVLDELSNAGCDALQWQALGAMRVHSSALHADLGLIYQALEERLAARKLCLRAGHLLAAARASWPEIEAVFADGFFSFTRAERELLAALGAQAHVTVTLPEWEGARDTVEDLTARGFAVRRRHRVRPEPLPVVFACSNQSHEALQIAHCLRELHAAGRPWREMGVVIRRYEPYGPLLETTLSRFGIPVRHYFGVPLTAHPVWQLLMAAVEAALAGFDHERMLPVLGSPVGLAGDSPARDRLDFLIREGLPDQGLGPLRRLAGNLPDNGPLLAMLDILQSASLWATETCEPSMWASRLEVLCALVMPPRPASQIQPEEHRIWRMRGAALLGFMRGLVETASLLPPVPISLDAFWCEARTVFDAATIRLPVRDREAVALLDVQEARQWELPVILLCGLVEGEFPSVPQPDPILDEATRFRLVKNGVPLMLQSERESREAFLLQVGLSRATRHLVLTWPRHDANGEPLLRSFEIERRGWQEQEASPVRLLTPAPPPPLAFPRLQQEDTLRQVAARHKTQRPTRIETFLQCPFLFFGRHTLELKAPPLSPRERLSLSAAGTLLHDVIHQWHQGAPDLMARFESEWARLLRRERIREGFRTADYHAILRRSLQAYQGNCWLESGWTVHTEHKVTLELEGVLIEGRVDRFDVNAEKECRVFDLKFTGRSGLQKRIERSETGLAVQGGLYSLALANAGYRPVSFRLAAVREKPDSSEWTGKEFDQLLENARRWTIDAAARIRQGEIDPRPADEKVCLYCDFRDACRIREARPAAAAAAEE
jgi:ATP-dependent helicase/DNAse subunit B